MQSANICIISHLQYSLWWFSPRSMLRHVQRKATTTCQALISVILMLPVINHGIYDHCNWMLINTTNGWKELEGTRNTYIQIFAQRLLLICADLSHCTRSKTKYGPSANCYWLFIRFLKKSIYCKIIFIIQLHIWISYPWRIVYNFKFW